jgi:hypothetical protein
MTMKRLLFFFVIVLLLGASCKKDTKLSEFIIGKWQSQEFVFINSQAGNSQMGYFIVTINTNNTFIASLLISAGAQTATSPSVGYKINDSRDQITLDQPILDPQVGTEVYNVLWKNGGNIMSWSPGDGTSTNSFLWTKE